MEGKRRKREVIKRGVKFMMLDALVAELFENLLGREGLDNVRKTIKDEVNKEAEYDKVKVEFQVFKDERNYDPELVEITSEKYDDGEVVFIDLHY